MEPQYKKRSELIYDLLQNKYKDIDIKFYFNQESSCYEFYIKNYKSNISILPDSKMKEIELIINKKREIRNNLSCSICEKESKKKSCCSKCGEKWCIQCYCNIFESGKGIMKCPYCRYQWGDLQSESVIPYMIKEIKLKAGLK